MLRSGYEAAVWVRPLCSHSQLCVLLLWRLKFNSLSGLTKATRLGVSSYGGKTSSVYHWDLQTQTVGEGSKGKDLFHLVQPCWLSLLPSLDVFRTVRYSLVTTEHLLKFCGILKLNLSHRPISVIRLYELHYHHDIRQKHHPRLLYLWISEWKFMCWKPDPQIHTLMVYRDQALEVVGTVAGPHEYPSYVSKSLCKS